MANKIYNEMKTNIDKSSLTTKNKKILHNINKLLSNYKNNTQSILQIPILIITKAIDNTDTLYIEKLLADMLKKYDVFGGKLQDNIKLSEYYDDILPKFEKNQAYTIEIDKNFIGWGGIKNYFNTIEKVIDTKSVFILLKCMPNTIEELEEHIISQKADYIISNDNSTVGELANRLLDRYKHNEINTNIDTKELKSLITHNLKADVYKTDEMCLQYMFLKSIKSYISSNRKSLEIVDIPKIEDTDKMSKKSNSQDNDLSKLVGLEYIKDEIDKIIKFATFNQQARKNNPDIIKENLNMCFLGNPRNTARQQLQD